MVPLVRDALMCPYESVLAQVGGLPEPAGQRVPVHICAKVSSMERIRIPVRRQWPRRPSPLDLRTPSGRPLPY